MGPDSLSSDLDLIEQFARYREAHQAYLVAKGAYEVEQRKIIETMRSLGLSVVA